MILATVPPRNTVEVRVPLGSGQKVVPAPFTLLTEAEKQAAYNALTRVPAVTSCVVCNGLMGCEFCPKVR